MPKSKLTIKQEVFCRLYTSAELFGNGQNAYAAAYGLDLTAERGRKVGPVYQRQPFTG